MTKGKPCGTKTEARHVLSSLRDTLPATRLKLALSGPGEGCFATRRPMPPGVRQNTSLTAGYQPQPNVFWKILCSKQKQQHLLLQLAIKLNLCKCKTCGLLARDTGIFQNASAHSSRHIFQLNHSGTSIFAPGKKTQFHFVDTLSPGFPRSKHQSAGFKSTLRYSNKHNTDMAVGQK